MKSLPSDPPRPSNPIPRVTRTRRQLWLEANPDYFNRSAHSLALPLAYDRLIRRYQTASERQAEGKAQGWAGMLEGALLRSEAKLDSVRSNRESDNHGIENGALTGAQDSGVTREPGAIQTSTPKRKGLKPLPEEQDFDGDGGKGNETPGDRLGKGRAQNLASRWDIPLGVVTADELLEASPAPEINDKPRPLEERSLDGPDAVVDGIDKEHALGRWHALLKARLLAGDDEDFGYATVDGDESLDGCWQESKRQEEWFEDEPEGWASDLSGDKQLQGETGIQDF